MVSKGGELIRSTLDNVVYDRISFLIDKDTIEEHLGYEITEEIFDGLVIQGNQMGDEFEEWFIENHIDKDWIKEQVKKSVRRVEEMN